LHKWRNQRRATNIRADGASSPAGGEIFGHWCLVIGHSWHLCPARLSAVVLGGFLPRWILLCFRRPQQFATDHVHLGRGLNADFHTAALDLENHDTDIFADLNSLIDLSGEYQHATSLCAGRMVSRLSHCRLVKLCSGNRATVRTHPNSRRCRCPRLGFFA